MRLWEQTFLATSKIAMKEIAAFGVPWQMLNSTNRRNLKYNDFLIEANVSLEHFHQNEK